MPMERPLLPAVRVDLTAYNDASFRHDFRFAKADMLRLVRHLGLPATWHTRNRHAFPALEAMLVVLGRLTFPARWVDLGQRIFGREPAQLSEVFVEVCSWLVRRFRTVLRWDERRLTPALLRAFAVAVDAPASTVGFVDGTLRFTARPTREQRVMYSGHKRHHGMKFQAVVTPDGLIVHLAGPYEGKKHDMGMLRDSQLLTLCARNLAPHECVAHASILS
jgi:hypothetical protein